jgi:hypothetical protein
MSFRYSTIFPRWPWAVGGLLSLLGLATGSHAQTTTLYNAAGNSFYQNGDIYNTGTVQNAGTYVPATGTLLVVGGNFLNSGTISISPAAATVKLLESVATTSHTLTLGSQTLPNLVLDVPAGTTMGSNGAISGTLSLLNGHLITSPAAATDYVLTLGAAATLVGETNAHYVKGRVAQARSLSGNSAVDFGNMGFSLNPAGNSFPLTVERRAGLTRAGVSFGVNPNVTTSQGIDRVWALSSPTVSVSAATMTLAWLSADDHGLTFSGANAQVWRSDNGGSTWVKQGAVQNGSSRLVSVAITNLNALYTVSTTAAPLPVELLLFTATKKAEDGLLNWKTASEKNSAYFDVQASADGRAWQTLDRITATGNSTTQQSYQYLDRTIARYGVPVVYYRLRQVDLDGTAQFSPLVTLSPDALAWQVTAYPNPYETDLTAQLLTSEAGPVTLTVLDAAGRVVLRREQSVTPGRQVIILDEARSLAMGTYMLQVRQNGHTGTVRIVRK